jgi:hypothetical protein
MKRPSYREAIYWLAHNDDTEWVYDAEPIASVTACIVADLFGVPTDKVYNDVKRELEKK